MANGVKIRMLRVICCVELIELVYLTFQLQMPGASHKGETHMQNTYSPRCV